MILCLAAQAGLIDFQLVTKAGKFDISDKLLPDPPWISENIGRLIQNLFGDGADNIDDAERKKMYEELLAELLKIKDEDEKKEFLGTM